eukprot:9273469-Lingulodinium_polyedra.AAC.1
MFMTHNGPGQEKTEKYTRTRTKTKASQDQPGTSAAKTDREHMTSHRDHANMHAYMPPPPPPPATVAAV